MNRLFPVIASIALSSCTVESDPNALAAEQASADPFTVTAIATLDEPWAMAFLPDGRLLVTEKKGRLLVVTQDGEKSAPIAGTPEVDYGGQGGFGDVVLHPEFANNHTVYLSYAEAGDGDTRGAALMRAKLTLRKDGGALTDQQVIWRQDPKVTGRGHYAHRIAFSSEGYMFVTSGDRQKMAPAQDMRQNLGKIIRLNDDGSVPSDNPFVDQSGVTAQIWTLGHRNPLGIAFDADGRLWAHEMGPRHGDELNLIDRAENYGWPEVSYGNHYDGRMIPDHDTQSEYVGPKVYWVPAISPAGMIIYSGDLFPGWKGSAFLGGMSSQSLVRVEIEGDTAAEAERFRMDHRVREIQQGPDGALWLLEDEDDDDGEGGRLLRLTPNR